MRWKRVATFATAKIHLGVGNFAVVDVDIAAMNLTVEELRGLEVDFVVIGERGENITHAYEMAAVECHDRDSLDVHVLTVRNPCAGNAGEVRVSVRAPWRLVTVCPYCDNDDDKCTCKAGPR